MCWLDCHVPDPALPPAATLNATAMAAARRSWCSMECGRLHDRVEAQASPCVGGSGQATSQGSGCKGWRHAMGEQSALLKDGVFHSYQRFPTKSATFSTGIMDETHPPATEVRLWMRKTARLLTPWHGPPPVDPDLLSCRETRPSGWWGSSAAIPTGISTVCFRRRWPSFCASV